MLARTGITDRIFTRAGTVDDLLFLHGVSEGGASRNYGIEAARLAGVPATNVQRARQVLDQLAAESLVCSD